MPHSEEYCITCRVRLELVSRRTIETIHSIQGVNLNTMHVLAVQDPFRIQYCDDFAYYLRCPRCHDMQAVSTTFDQGENQ